MLLHTDLPLEWVGRGPVVVGLTAGGLIYTAGWRQDRRRLPGRLARPHLAAFLGGLACLCLAIASPLDEAADTLLSAHMVQHSLLFIVAPALLLVSQPLLPLLRGLPDSLRRSLVAPLLRQRSLRAVAHALVHPLAALLLSSVIFWSWHFPVLYQLALRLPAVHLVEHASFLAGGLLFWYPVVQPWPSRPRWPRAAMIPYLLAADVQNTVLAAVLTFSDRVLYPFYEFHSPATEAAALNDQVLAGVIMWVPMSLAYLVPAALLTIRLLSPSDRGFRAVSKGSVSARSVKPEHTRWCAAALACVATQSLTGPCLRAQASPSPITFSAGSWQLTLGGYFKLDLIHDFDANSSPDFFDPRSIPVDGSKGTNTRIHARETRLSLGIQGPAEGRNIELFLEGDFYGTGNALRLRHAYAQYGALLAGQTWTTVMDERNIPPTIDFETPLAAPLVRQGLLRVTTGLSKRSELAFAVEESDPEILLPAGVQGSPEKTWPDFTTRFRFTHSRGHVQLSGFVGRTRFRAATGATSDVTIGGVLASTRVSLFDRDTAYFQVAYGPGVGRYRGAASAALDAAGRLETVDVVGLTVGYQHYWSRRWSSNAVVSPAWVVSEVGDPATSNDSFNYVAVNLLYWFIDQRAWIGSEYLYGRRELRSGVHGSGNRIQLATCFNILK